MMVGDAAMEVWASLSSVLVLACLGSQNCCAPVSPHLLVLLPQSASLSSLDVRGPECCRHGFLPG